MTDLEILRGLPLPETRQVLVTLASLMKRAGERSQAAKLLDVATWIEVLEESR